MPDDFVLNVKQIGQYPQNTSPAPFDAFLHQIGGVGGAYAWMSPDDLVSGALVNSSKFLRLGINSGIAFNGAALTFAGGVFTFSEALTVNGVFTAPAVIANSVTVAGQPVATQATINASIAPLSAQIAQVEAQQIALQTWVQQFVAAALAHVVTTFNGRSGAVTLGIRDITFAGGAPLDSPHFSGFASAPTPWDPETNTDQIATTAFVHQAVCKFMNDLLANQPFVFTFNGRRGNIQLTTDDVNDAFFTTTDGAVPQAPNPAPYDSSNRIATTFFVSEITDGMEADILSKVSDLVTQIASQLDQKFAPLNSPVFTGTPTAPTPNPGDNSGNIATTAYVAAAVAASTAGVASFNGRTGIVTLAGADVSGAGGALLASPIFTGSPTGPTPTAGDQSTRLATTQFVHDAITGIVAGVASFNTRTGAVVLTTADVTGVGAALLASPAFSGTPTAPTAAPATNNTQLATTAYVTSAIAALAVPVTSFNGRTGAITFLSTDVSAVGGAMLASPIFTGNPQAPTPVAGDNDNSIATTAFVQAALIATVGVTTFNGRNGAVTLTTADITGVGGALLAGPTFTGTPAGPTATVGTNSTQLATTAFVQAALAQAPGGVSSFNTRTGAITLTSADVSAAGGALIASPNFTGNPLAPTASPGNNTTSIATTAFVQNALATAGGVNSFNGRAGAVVLNAADIFGADGAVFRQADAAPAFANNTLWFDSVRGQLYVHYKDPSTSADNWVIANSVPSPSVPVPLNYLGGLTLTGSTNTVVAATGSAASDDNSALISLTTAMSKTMLTTWSPGSGSGALDTGSLAPNTWYHVLLLFNPTTRAADMILSVSISPLMTLPNAQGFTQKRRIGSIRTNATGQVTPFVQLNDDFLWVTPVQDANAVNGLVTTPTALPLTVPTGVKVVAHFRATFYAAGVPQNVTFQSPDTPMSGAGNNVPVGNMSITCVVAGASSAGEFNVRTNTQGQIIYAKGGGNVSLVTHGWKDYRGK